MGVMGGIVTNCQSGAAIWSVYVYLLNGLGPQFIAQTDNNGEWYWIDPSVASGMRVRIGGGNYPSQDVTMNQTAYYPQLGVTGLWAQTCLTEAPQPASCFTGDTQITMADESERSIDLIQVGDLVLGTEGQFRQVTAIERTNLGNRLLYALNGSGPFVTGEHPFMTKDGWKSIDPAATLAENFELHVARLEVGDGLMTRQVSAVAAKAAGSKATLQQVELRLQSIILDGIHAVYADPSTQLYNLLLDGDHCYFANGLLVHNKNGH